MRALKTGVVRDTALACDSLHQTPIPRLGDYCLAAVQIRKRSDAAAA